MEKEQRKRTEMIPYLQDTMEETFQYTCREIQTVLDTDACRIWRGFHDAVCECLKAAGALQRQRQKGSLNYLAFSMMRHALWLDRLELRIDAVDDTFFWTRRRHRRITMQISCRTGSLPGLIRVDRCRERDGDCGWFLGHLRRLHSQFQFIIT